jgi:hypothetical protein
MKQRITRRDLENLTNEQKRRLNELWTPSVYDVAVAKVLKSVATDEYDEYEFVVGEISLSGTSIYLTNISAVKTETSSQSEPSYTVMKTEEPRVEDSLLTVKVDTFFGESISGFGNRDDYNRATEGMVDSLGDEYDENTDDEQEQQEEVFQEEDLEDNYQLPTTLIKVDCTPLLTIGNMIEILQNNHYGKFDFFFSVSTNDIGCELGEENSSWGNHPDWEPAELCDVLWESIKELL